MGHWIERERTQDCCPKTTCVSWLGYFFVLRMFPYCYNVRPSWRQSPPTVWRPPVGLLHYTTWRRRRKEPPVTIRQTRRRRLLRKTKSTNSDDISVDTIADGQHEVNMLDLGISTEDIAAMWRIDARLEEARRTQHQALEARPSEPQMVTRVKVKETMLTQAERQE